MGIPSIPEKLYFRIGEVAELTGVKPSVLRYWESEFGTLRPSKSRSNQRLYTRSDIEKVFRLKTLLYEKKFTIAGARRILAKGYDREIQQIEPQAIPVNEPPPRSAEAGPKDLAGRLRSLISQARSIKELLS